MSERTSYEPGTPSWVDLSSPDPEASKAFYAGLFGWRAEDTEPVEETEGYVMFKLKGRNVAGMSPIQDDSQSPAWWTYVDTDDVDAAAARVTEAGGSIPVGPIDVVDAGRMAFIATRPPASSASGRPTGTRAPRSSTSPARSTGTSCRPATSRAPRPSVPPCSAGAPTTRTSAG